MFKTEAHKYLMNIGCLSAGQQYTAFEIEKMLNDFAQHLAKNLNIPDVVNGEVDVPPVRVRWYGEHTDDIFDGTVIGNDNIYYFVIPDENTSTEIKWRKTECDVLR